MKGQSVHPKDFSPYLDREVSDRDYGAIETHLVLCSECREEVRSLRSLDALFRSPELTIEVPPYQWERIAARLNHPRPAARWRERLPLPAWQPLRLAWIAAALSALAVFVLLGTMEYRKYEADQNILSQIIALEAEQRTQDRMDNPFQAYLEPTQELNPFEDYRYPDTRKNPFATLR